MKQLFKKSILLSLLAMPWMAQAQEKNWWEGWMNIMHPTVTNTNLSESDPTGQPLKAGGVIVNQGFIFYNAPTVPISALPTDAYYNMRLHDVYNVFDKKEDFAEDMNLFLNLMYTNAEDTEAGTASKHWIYTIVRGGEYQLQVESPAIGIQMDSTMTIYDVPALYTNGNTLCKVGADSTLNMTYRFNTGYPYSQDTLKAEEQLSFKLYRQTKDGQELLDEKNQTFTLLDKTKPLLAGLYDYTYKPAIKEPGAYELEMQSSWNNLKKYVEFNINDTLRAEATLDKSIYQIGTDKKAVLHVKMDQGYPYVQPEEENAKPVIEVRYKLQGETGSSLIPIYADTLRISEDSLATKHFYIDKDIEIPLDEAFAEYTFNNNPETITLALEIYFNGATHASKALPLLVNNSSTDIKEVKSSTQKKDGRIYDLSGRRVTKMTPRNIYIQNGKKVVNFK